MKAAFGEKLKKARLEKEMKQSELAKYLGVTNTTISNWENNISKPDLDMLSYICGILNVKVSYFLEARPSKDEISILEFEIIEKYRKLDPITQEHILSFLDWEVERAEQLRQAASASAAHPPD